MSTTVATQELEWVTVRLPRETVGLLQRGLERELQRLEDALCPLAVSRSERVRLQSALDLLAQALQSRPE